MTVVREFHQTFDLACPEAPPLFADPDEVRLRMRLIKEEYDEVFAELVSLLNAHTPEDVLDCYARLLKELADLRYVVEGTAVSFALPIDEAYLAVHESNMSKVGDGGQPIRDVGGKVLKGPNYKSPAIYQFVPTIETITYQEDLT